MANVERQLDLIQIIHALTEIPLQYTDRDQALQKLTELGRQAMGSHACTITHVDP